MVCLGIDPGLARVGYGAVAQSGFRLRALNYGCIETSPELAFTERLLMIYEEMQRQIEICKPDLVSIERLFFGRNTTTAEYVYQARGAIMLLTAQNKLPVVEPKPNQIKMALCGTGDAVKSQVQGMVQRFLALDEIPKPDDTADALAAAVTGLALKFSS
ncbi:MAG: crossover junction endodeoxyribonuclease RuvC [Synergistaceae bacterium]|nr:crossover junction endodeoxyribonuclease RuvC [Synergistaceae bacterium]